MVIKTAVIVIFFTAIISAQVETVPADHIVYPFLKKLHVQGILKNYNDIILPFSKQKIVDALNELDKSKEKLSNADKEFLLRMKEKFLPAGSINLFDEFPGNFSHLFDDTQKSFYKYVDDEISFHINPVVDYSYLYSSRNDASSSLLNLGGKIYGSYYDWFGFYLQGSNGIQFGNRETALHDQRVAQSYTFNNTGINFFDGTKGYLRLQKGIISFQLGRERIIWGGGYVNKLLLSENPPMFDFIKFDAEYKSLSYNFIHGWLVQPPVVTYINERVGNVKEKKPKYFAVSRLGFNPTNYISIGVSQVIVYSNRSFEAAYLNPFLFWESAQRSMNDLDNSMLSVDARSLITSGVELSASVIFDDLDFSNLGNESVDNTNGSAWQAGTFITSPVLPENLVLKIEYLQLRPYMFSHPGIGEALTFTNNSYMLGIPIQPNSTLFSAELLWRLNGKINFGIKYNYYLHGANEYDEEGNLVRNVGGNVFENLSLADSQKAFLLDGIRERSDEISLSMIYELAYGLFFKMHYSFLDFDFTENKNHEHNFKISLIIDFE